VPGAVIPNGPEQPERVAAQQGLIGFLSHTGTPTAHGYEGIAYLCEQFRANRLRDPAPMITRRSAGAGRDRPCKGTHSTRAAKKTGGSLDIAKLPG